MSDHEKNIALRAAAEAVSEDAFFKKYQHTRYTFNRMGFDYGFIRGCDRRQPEIDALTARVAELEGAAK